MTTQAAGDKLGHDVDVLKSDLAKVQKDISQIASKLMNRGVAGAEGVKETVQETVEDGIEKMQGYIENRPVTSVLVALGVGMLAGMLFCRK